MNPTSSIPGIGFLGTTTSAPLGTIDECEDMALAILDDLSDGVVIGGFSHEDYDAWEARRASDAVRSEAHLGDEVEREDAKRHPDTFAHDCAF